MEATTVEGGPEMEHSRMALTLRLIGWTLFLTGAIIMFLLDTITGLIISGAGIFCTMACNLIANYAYLKKRKEEIEPYDELDADAAARAKQVIREKREAVIRKDSAKDAPRLEKPDE